MDSPKPNIVFILTDDLGYGDVGCNNPDSRIPTPNIDRMAGRGMNFSDAHASSAVCTPSRYSILTGEYCWRSQLKSSVLWAYDPPIIETGKPTVAGFLREHGYSTTAIGKWHLGMEWELKDGRKVTDALGDLPLGSLGNLEERLALADQLNYRGRLGGGPVDHGFDHYFGIDVPNFPPYTWFEDDRLAEIPTAPKGEAIFGHGGLMIENWSHEAMLPAFARRSVDFIKEQAGQDKPFFLYLALTSPHTPVCPNEAFKGSSQAGEYGDFVVETDHVVGQVIEALEASGQLDNTLVIFTSDNGPECSPPLKIGAYERVQEYDHYSMGELRGVKRDAWEGGHRVPFIAQWPAVCPAGRQCEQTICLGDLFATVIDMLDTPCPADAAPDSISFLSLLEGQTGKPTRDHLIHHSCTGLFAIREGEWVLIDSPTGQDTHGATDWPGEPDWFKQQRGYREHDQPAELYNLAEDIKEAHNRFAQEPERARAMLRKLREIQGEEARCAIRHIPDSFLSE